MSQPTVQANTKLIDALAQIILSLSREERQLLDQRIEHFQSPVHSPLEQSNPDPELFFQELNDLETDPSQPTLQEISQVVKEVRRELWSGQ